MTNENLKHAETLVNQLREEHGEEALNLKVDEVIEFLEAAEDEIISLKDEVNTLQEDVDSLKRKDDEDDDDYGNSENFGLDTFEWRLENGNLLIQQKVEDFVINLKKELGMLP